MSIEDYLIIDNCSDEYWVSVESLTVRFNIGDAVYMNNSYFLSSIEINRSNEILIKSNIVSKQSFDVLISSITFLPIKLIFLKSFYISKPL